MEVLEINSRLETRLKRVLTGFNTDVEYDGVVYHVQTEDKGLRTPFILSLVYTGGEILASKRAPYEDLIAQGFDEGVLAQRLSRQHKLICAAVHAGRIADLKRMGERSSGDRNSAAGIASGVREGKQSPESPPANFDQSKRPSENETPSEAAGQAPVPQVEDLEEPLKVILLDDEEFRGGESTTLSLLVTQAGSERREPARQARVLVKVLGSTFRPQSIQATTNDEGLATVAVAFPNFETGRAAILVQAHVDGQVAETRRIILPTKSS